MNEYENLNRELREAGVPNHVFMGQEGSPIDTLVNTKTSSHPYQGILIDYLRLTTYINHIRAHRPFGFLKGNKNDFC